ncbi:MAG TPA: hypothetical protein VGP16_14525 [Asanoa sp.]|nr:hypothetical protein [Asanoa sp.]
MSEAPVYGPPFGPPPKRRRWGLIIGLTVGGLVFLCCAGGVTFIGLTASQTKPAKAAAESYVNAVIAGDDADARRYLCSATDSSHADFTNYVHSNGVSDSQVVGTKVTLWNFSWKATVQVELTASAGAHEDLELPLAKEDGKWKVCG